MEYKLDEPIFQAMWGGEQHLFLKVLFIITVPTGNVFVFVQSENPKIYYFCKFLFLVGTMLDKHAYALSMVLFIFGHGGEL